MVHHLKDILFKEMAEHHRQHFINLLHPAKEYEIVSTKLDKELIVRKRKSDFAVKVRTGRRVFLFHFEFVSKYRRQDLRKANGYSGALSLKYKCDVVTIIFVLKPPSKRAKRLGYYEIAPFGKPMNVHDLAVVHLWELRDEILAGKKEYLPLVPILPEISQEVDIDLLKRQGELLAMIDEPATAAFAQAFYNQKDITNYILEDKKMYEHWEQVPGYGDHIRMRVREGEKKGTINTLKQDIMETLELRFGLANGKVANYVDKINKPEKLRKLFRLIIKAKTLDQVKETLSIP